MSEQLDIFASGIYCWYCGNDPGRREHNAGHWNGFFDADSLLNVCMACKAHHYWRKAQTIHANMYSEMPVVIPPTILTDKKKSKPHNFKQDG